MKRTAIALLMLIAAAATAQHQAEVMELLKSDDWEKALVRFTIERARLTKDLIKALDDRQVATRAAIALRAIDTHEQEIRSGDAGGLGVDNRKQAVEALQRFARETADKEAVWTLAYLLRNRDFGHHGEPWSDPKELAPLVALGKKATPALVLLLTDKGPQDELLYAAKISAVRVLKATKDPAAADSLIEIVRREDGWMLWGSIQALIELNDVRTPRVLIDRIEISIHSYSETPAIWGLKKMKGAAVPDLLWAIENHASADVRHTCLHIFHAVTDPRALPLLRKLSADPDERIRACAVTALEKTREPTNKPLFTALLRDHASVVRAAAVSALGVLKDPTTFSILTTMLKDDEITVRQQAAVALARVGGARSIKFLVPMLADPRMHRVVIDALRPLEPKKLWEKELIEILRTGHQYERRDAAEILGKMRSIAAMPNLLLVMQDDSFTPRQAAARALGRLGKPSVEPLLQLLPNAKGDMLHDVLLALAHTGDRRGFDAAVPYLQDEKARRHVVEGLGKSSDRRAIPLIMQFCTHHDEHLRDTVYEALGNLRAVDAVPRLLWALDNDRTSFVSPNATAAQALAKIGDKRAFEPLLKAAQDPEFRRRWMAIEALGVFKDSRAVPTLIKLLEAEWPDNAAAARALGRIGDASALPSLEKAAASDEERLVVDAKAAIEAINKVRKRG